MPFTAPVKIESEATDKEFARLVPMLTLPLAAKRLLLVMVTDAPTSVELKIVVAAVTVRLLVLATEPSTVLPLTVRLPAMATSELAAKRALAVMGPAVLEKVVTAFTFRVWPPAALPTVVLPATARFALATTAALTVTGPAVELKVVTALTNSD